MPRLRTFFALAAVAVLGACSDVSGPSSPPSSPDLSQQKAGRATASPEYQGRAPLAMSQRDIDAQHFLRCNFYRTCIRIQSETFSSAIVHAQGYMEFTGCTAVRYFVNGRFIFQSGTGCFRRGTLVYFNLRIFNFFRFDRVCTVWTGAGPRGTICQVK
jgi:hypothetical protein